MKAYPRFLVWVFAAFLILPATARAGMPKVTFTLTDAARPRLQTISFFLVGFLLSAVAIMLLWNYLRKDWTFLPRLNFWRALVVVGLWGLLFILVLTMISGARELMTPGAWEQKGSTYRLVQESNTDDLDQRRRRQLEHVRDALWEYARVHDGRFPSIADANSIADQLWKLPGTVDMRFGYLGGEITNFADRPVAHELEIYGPERYVLFSNGDIRKMDSEQLATAIDGAKK